MQDNAPVRGQGALRQLSQANLMQKAPDTSNQIRPPKEGDTGIGKSEEHQEILKPIMSKTPEDLQQQSEKMESAPPLKGISQELYTQLKVS